MTPAELAYKTSAASAIDADTLVSQELSQVYYIAARIRERLPQHVDMEDLVSAGEQLLLPGVDESRVDAVLAGQLVDGSIPLKGSQGDLGLERRRVLLALAFHRLPLSWATRVA